MAVPGTQSMAPSQSDVAIIGMAGRFPGAAGVEEFWENLCGAKESIRTFSKAELLAAGVSAVQVENPNYVGVGAPLADLEMFDAGFFGINPKDAAIMDPQQRLFLECCWGAMEHSGHAPGALDGAVGVFAGSGPNSYLFYNLLSDRKLVENEGIFALRHGGNDKDVLATRVSYQLNLHGPSINVQTACSTSLVAVHLACQSLLNGECDLALAGAVSIEIPHNAGYLYREGEILSRDGHCRAFDAQASGTVFGSGLGVIVLRRLADAVEGGDTIYAIIKGSAINNDGGRKVGYLAPSVEGQVDAVAEALAVAGVDAGTIDYIEAHGTGTVIGDPIELAALGQVFAGRPRPLHVGSVKTNIGHLDTASGIAGLIKTTLAVSRRRIPPTLHFTKPNPLIDFGKAQIHIVDRLMEWPESGSPRRAGVTSLGIGGSNAHVVLEQAPEMPPSGAARPVQVLTLSAKSPAALDAATADLARHLERNPILDLSDAAYTLHLGRCRFPHGRVVVCNDINDALSSLRTLDPQKVASGETSAKGHGAAFMFSGQGSQYVNMGRTLYAAEPVFRKWIDACASVATPLLGIDFRSVLYPSEDRLATAVGQIRETWITQPCLFAVEYALAQLWMSWGVRPARMLGHSIGEYVAACLAGVFSFEDAIAVVAARGLLMGELGGGAMLAVAKPESEIRALLNQELSLAAVNAPDQCVLSGSVEAIETIERGLSTRGILAKRLQTSHAFHSRLMEPGLGRFEEVVRQKHLDAPRIPVLSNLTGTWLSADEARDPHYWALHLRNTVRFEAGLDVLLSEPDALLLEVGPGETLTSFARRHSRRSARHRVFSSLPTSAESGRDMTAVVSALGHLWLSGVEVDWKGFHAHERRRRIPLPTYPFERRKFWIGPVNAPTSSPGQATTIGDWFYRVGWERTESTARDSQSGPWLIFCDSAGAGQKLAENLRRDGQEAVTVSIGSEFQNPRPGSFSINPSSDADFSTLMGALGERQWPRRVGHFWALEAGASMRRSPDLCFHSLLRLMQHLGRRVTDHPIRVGVFTHGAVSVNGEQVLNPGQATVSGPCRVAPKEYSHLLCRQIDVDTIEPTALARIGLAELAADSHEPLVAYRKEARWTERLERSALRSGPNRLRERGVYLITGGLSGLGFATAKWLSHAYQARLVLVSRNGLARAARLQAEMQEMEREGAEVLVMSADVSDLEAMRAVLSEGQKRFGRLDGVIHAAGVLDDGVIELKTKARADCVLEPKLHGTRVLSELLQDVPLEFFTLFSSVSAWSPPAGQVDYSSANAYLNALAQSCAPARKVVAIGWGAWAEIGMAAASEAVRTRFTPPHPLIESLDLDSEDECVCSGTLSLERHWILKEHRVHGGAALLPGTGHLELAVTAAWRKIGRKPLLLRDVIFHEPLLVGDSHTVEFRAELHRTSAGYRFSNLSGKTVFASGEIALSSGAGRKLDLANIGRRCNRKESSPRNVRQEGHFDFGPRWRSIRSLSFGQDECLALLELPLEFAGEVNDYSLHPALLDMATGVCLFLIPGYDRPGEISLPFSYRQAIVHKSLPARVYSHARIRRSTEPDIAVFDITITDAEGTVIMDIEEFAIKRVSDPARTVFSGQKAEPAVAAPRGSTVADRQRISTSEGIKALQMILNSGTLGVVLVSPENPSPVVESPRPKHSAKGLSRDDVDSALKEMWERLLGVENVGANADFFQLGGHSLIAVRLFSEIRAQFQVELGLSTLFEARTLGALTGRVREEQKKRGGKPVGELHCVVPIRTGGSRVPFFCIHGVGGNVLNYEELVRHLDTDQPVYGVQSRGLSGVSADTTIEKMAAVYVEEIRQVQPEGPYMVGGQSFGGLVAYEIGCQLEAEGQPVGLVALIDSSVNYIMDEGFWGSFVAHASFVCGRIKGHARKMVLGPDRVAYLLARAKTLRRKAGILGYRTKLTLLHGVGQELPANLENVKQANYLAGCSYVPRSCKGSVVLFRCAERALGDHPDYLMGWRNLARGGVHVEETPGDHVSMLKEPHVRVLAQRLSACLQEASRGSHPLVQANSSELMLGSQVSK